MSDASYGICLKPVLSPNGLPATKSLWRLVLLWQRLDKPYPSPPGIGLLVSLDTVVSAALRTLFCGPLCRLIALRLALFPPFTSYGIGGGK